MIIDNFFIGLYDYVECSSGVVFGVDVTDTNFSVTLSGTYFTYNGVDITPTYTTISGGYRLEYFTVPSGNITLDVHATNDNYEIALKTYEMYYGYQCTYNEVVNYEPGVQVPVTIEASNNVVAPNTSTLSTFFDTRGYAPSYLGAFITADGSGYIGLESDIAAQSKYLLSGKTYSVTVEGVKDFSGNIMPPTTFTFTVEN